MLWMLHPPLNGVLILILIIPKTVYVSETEKYWIAWIPVRSIILILILFLVLLPRQTIIYHRQGRLASIRAIFVNKRSSWDRVVPYFNATSLTVPRCNAKNLGTVAVGATIIISPRWRPVPRCVRRTTPVNVPKGIPRTRRLTWYGSIGINNNTTTSVDHSKRPRDCSV